MLQDAPARRQREDTQHEPYRNRPGTGHPPATRRRLERAATRLRQRRAALRAQLSPVEEPGDTADWATAVGVPVEIEEINARLARLDRLLTAARTSAPADADTVVVGSRVTVRFADGEEETYWVGLIDEGKAEAGLPVLTPTSPLGRALLGCRPGADITSQAPTGSLTVQLIATEPETSAAGQTPAEGSPLTGGA